MARRVGFLVLSLLAFGGASQAGGPVGVPMPPAGVFGPVILAGAIAAYMAYRLYRRYSRKIR
jgi:hypothetical protein